MAQMILMVGLVWVFAKESLSLEEHYKYTL
jgi:hypothetical protein